MGSKRPAASDVAAFDAVENGVISLFSARVLDIFGGWPLLDLALVCLGGLVVKRALGGLRSHVMETLEGVVKGIVLKITLEAMSDKDLAAHAAHLLCAFLLLHAFDAGGLGSAAKYVFASQVAKAFASDQFLGAVLCVALQANMPALAATPRLQECAQLVVTQLVFQWFSEGIPPGMEIPTTLLCVYLMAPLLGADGGASPSPVFAELYTFVLYQASYAVRFPGADAWTQAAFAASVWKLSTDPATATIARFSSIHRVNQIVLDASEAEIRTDPMLAMGAMVVGLRIVLELVR